MVHYQILNRSFYIFNNYTKEMVKNVTRSIKPAIIKHVWLLTILINNINENRRQNKTKSINVIKMENEENKKKTTL